VQPGFKERQLPLRAAGSVIRRSPQRSIRESLFFIFRILIAVSSKAFNFPFVRQHDQLQLSTLYYNRTNCNSQRKSRTFILEILFKFT
jgi:hypothetical protein